MTSIKISGEVFGIANSQHPAILHPLYVDIYLKLRMNLVITYFNSSRSALCLDDVSDLTDVGSVLLAIKPVQTYLYIPGVH